MAPSRQGDMAKFAIRSLFAATIACFMTASIAGERIKRKKKRKERKETGRLILLFYPTHNNVRDRESEFCKNQCKSLLEVS